MPRTLHLLILLPALVAALVGGAGCRAAPPLPEGAPQPVHFAEGFRLLVGDGFTLAEVTRPWPDARDTLRYLLVPKEVPVPAGFGDLPVIRTPLERVVALSTTHLALLDAVGAADRVVGVADAGLVFTPSIRARLEQGSVVAVGEGEALSAERVAALRPDAVLLSSLGATGATTRTLEAAGIPVVALGEWVETTPLGRAEWVRFVAALFAADAHADTLMAGLAQRYEALARAGRAATPKPTVFVGSSFQGVWYAPGGGSYMAALLRDAGGRYLWYDTPQTGSLALDLEAVLARAQHADVWLHPGVWASRADGAAQEARYRLFDAFGRGAIYNYDRRVSPGGGYAFFETGVVEPDVVLADLIHFLHPDVLPEHAPVYYRQVD